MKYINIIVFSVYGLSLVCLGIVIIYFSLTILVCLPCLIISNPAFLNALIACSLDTYKRIQSTCDELIKKTKERGIALTKGEKVLLYQMGMTNI